MERPPLETQTLYAELMEHLVANEAHRAMGHLPGCFTVKRVKGKRYYYYQYSGPGGVVRQVYVGRRSETLDRVVERFHGFSSPLQRGSATPSFSGFPHGRPGQRRRH